MSIKRNPAVTPQRVKKGLAGPMLQFKSSDSSAESEMAKAESMSRRNHLHDEMRWRTVGMLPAGARKSAVARELNVHRSVIHRLWKHYHREQNASRRRGYGHRRITTTADDCYLLQCARRRRTLTARQLGSQLSAAAGNPISLQTLSRGLHEGRLFVRRPVVCVPLSPALVRARLHWAREHRSWTPEHPSYDEEFTRELLGSIKEERGKREESEKQEREIETEREKQEREREIEREREAREERERVRAFELQKLELEVRGGRAQPVESRHVPDQPAKIRMHDVMPRFNPKENDVSLFLVLFERQAKIMNIPAETQVTQLISLLPTDIVQLIGREPEEDAKKYEYIEALLLQRFKLSAEKFRQLFSKHQKAPESIWYDFYYELKNYLEGWLNGLNVKTFEQLKDLMLVNKIKKRTSMEFKEHFMNEWTTIISPTEMVKKIEDFEDVRKTIKPKLFATQTERTNKGQFKPRYENFSKKIEHPSHLKLSDKWNDYRHQKITVKEKAFDREIDFQIRIKIILLTKDIDHVVSSAGHIHILNRNALA
ncbi:hypothetical protein AVEN_237778-1 [Araneus ventricosus]|uniref:Transposase Tc1-like domain-containing protein n=1 Tax=Araneus ventricosus TaxID=182803 RepID=A0A4Y2NTV8_ARAVE|nr:hypothetical protein AVEN_237778-1 [Araneus ventricosus]